MEFQRSKEQLKIIRNAYDDTVERYNNGLSDLDFLPDEFKESAEFKRFRDLMSTCNSGDPGIKDYLEPKNGLRYLDIGSCLNLMEYDLYQWPSNYYGIDISQKLIRVAKSFINTNRIKIGGLLVAEISNLPFDNNYFDIASAIGVLEYYELAYITQALKELNRILKRKGKLVIDMPNERHPDIHTMVEYESYLGRTRKNIPSEDEFVDELKRFFIIDKVADAQIMIQYFARKRG